MFTISEKGVNLLGFELQEGKGQDPEDGKMGGKMTERGGRGETSLPRESGV